MRLAGLGLVLIGCTDLPKGWENARRIDIDQSLCQGSPSNDIEDTGQMPTSPDIRGAAQSVIMDATTTFRCEQEVEGFARTTDKAIDVLLQPRQMDPKQVAKCDCLYDFAVVIQSVEPGDYDAALFRRGDNSSGQSTPEKLGEAEIVVTKGLSDGPSRAGL